MGRLTVVKREVVRGATGAPGVNAVPADAFIADRVATPGSETRTALDDDFAAKSTQLEVEAGRLSVSELDETYASAATQDTVETGRLSTDTLGETYAARSVQDAVELGRLNDAVLTGRFGIPLLWIGAEQMWAGQGTPTAATIASFTSTWRFNASVDQGAIFSRRLPKEWLTFDVYAVGANGGAGTGAVRIVGQWKNSDRDGELFTGGLSAGSGGVQTVGLEHVQMSIKVRSGLLNDPTARHHFRIYRTPTDAADTLANDWELAGVLLVPTAFAQIEPELPEEPPSLEGRTFTQAHNALLDIQVHHQAGPPVDDTDDEEYKFFPGTDYSSRQIGISTSTFSGGKWGSIWDNRWNYGDAHSKKPNLTVQPVVMIGSRQARTVFTTQALAQAATRAQIRHYLGFSTGDIQSVWTAAGGLVGNIITDTQFRTTPETYCTTEFSDGGEVYMVATDYVVLPAFQFDASFDGVFLDYEPHDTRTPAETTAHISAITADCHAQGYQLFLYTNPLNGNAMPYNGIDATNLPTLLDTVDFITVLLWAGNDEGSIAASYAAQIAMFGTITTPEWAKIAITFELGPDSSGTTMADAEWVYDKMHEPGTTHPTTVVVWRNGAVHGGSPSRLLNKRLSMLLFGTDNPPTP